jgi:hypothetical protein
MLLVWSESFLALATISWGGRLPCFARKLASMSAWHALQAAKNSWKSASDSASRAWSSRMARCISSFMSEVSIITFSIALERSCGLVRRLATTLSTIRDRYTQTER